MMQWLQRSKTQFQLFTQMNAIGKNTVVDHCASG
jgi:hypothetical protein